MTPKINVPNKRLTGTPQPPGTALRGGLLGAGLAVAGCLLVYFVGSAGAPVRVVTGSAPEGADLGPGSVVASAALGVALGTLLLGWLERVLARGFRVWVAIAAVTAVVSAIPLWWLAIDTRSKVFLTAMHLVAGLAALAGQWLVRHGRLEPVPAPSTSNLAT